ncbi:TonB-dependent receptor plug domain-containing protein [Niabella aquatica]
MKREILVVAAVILYGTLQAQNQTTDKDLDEVVVTASRKEQKQSQTGKVVTVIDQATLQNNIGKSLTEILNQYAGIFTVGANNAPGSNQELYLRGAATGNTLVLIDGIPLQDPSHLTNTYDLNNIRPDQVERIEILKGAQSTLWGSNAVAGVINIITKKGGTGKITPAVTVAYGSYNTLKLGAGVNGTLDKFSYNLFYNRITTDGFSAAYDSLGNRNFDKDGLKQNSFQANLGYRFTNTLSLNFTSNYGDYKADADADAYIDDYDNIIKNKNFVNSLGLNYKTEKSALHLVQNIIRSDRYYFDDSTDIGGLRVAPQSSYYAIWSDGNYKGRSYVTDLYGNHNFTDRLSLVSGLQYVYQHTDQSYKSISSIGPYNAVPVSSDSAKSNNFSVYASFLVTDLKGFNIEAGGRYNHHSVYGGNGTFTFNPSYNIDEHTRVFVNISSGYNTPSLYQLYSEYGNRALSPEKSVNYEVGVQALTNDNRNSFRIVGFKRDIKDLVVFYTDASTFTSKYINRDEQHDHGFEVESNIAVGNIGQWVNNLTYVNGAGMNDGKKTKNLFRRPDFTLNSTLTLQPVKGLTLVPAFRYIGERMPVPNVDLGGPDPMPAYYTIDFYAAYNIIKGKAKLFTDFRNITNQKYFDVYGYNSRQANFMIGISAAL